MIDKKISVQIFGDYLNDLPNFLTERGIETENIISRINPLAVSGETNAAYQHYSDEIEGTHVALNAKKNLAQMLSHNAENFCSNKTRVSTGEEVRYKNNSNYIIVCNSYAAVTLFEDKNSVYSDMWPQNKMTEELKSNRYLRVIRFPFPKNFCWKYYYDQFINSIVKEYDAEHIILIKINSSRWYMNGEEIESFDPNSKTYKNQIEEIDNYFEFRTGCYTVNSHYSHIPSRKGTGSFPYISFEEYCQKMIADSIADIIYGRIDARPERRYHNPLTRYIVRRISKRAEKIFESDLNYLEYQWAESLLNCSKNMLSNEILYLGYFLNPEENNGLFDLLCKKTVLSQKELDDRLNLMISYIKYCNFDINDLISVYKFYSIYRDKADFSEAAAIILNKTDYGPIKESSDIVNRNLSYLKDYEFISRDLLNIENKNTSIVSIGNNCYIKISLNSDNLFEKIIINKQKLNWSDILKNDYRCDIKQAEDVCNSWKVYIEKARKGDGNKPFIISFYSKNDFLESLYYVDYVDLLNTESFIVSLENDTCEFTQASAKTNLDFLFKPNVKICVIANGLADQLAYYVFSQVLKEKTGSDIYYLDRSTSAYLTKRQFDKFANYDLSDRLISNIISKKLFNSINGTSISLANTLYDNGISDIEVYLGGWCASQIDNVKSKKYAISDIMSFFNISGNALGYIWCLIRPDEIMEHIPFEPEKYIHFPEFDTEKNKQIAQQMIDCDSVSVHIRRGDFVTVGRADDLSFYKNAIKEVLEVERFNNKKWFIFSDDIPFCKSHTAELGLDLVGNDEICYVDNNKWSDSFRDMQLMTYSKVIIGGNSGFSRFAAIMSKRCEKFIYGVNSVMELHKRLGRTKSESVSKTADYKNIVPPSSEVKDIATEDKNAGGGN